MIWSYGADTLPQAILLARVLSVLPEQTPLPLLPFLKMKIAQTGCICRAKYCFISTAGLHINLEVGSYFLPPRTFKTNAQSYFFPKSYYQVTSYSGD